LKGFFAIQAFDFLLEAKQSWWEERIEAFSLPIGDLFTEGLPF